MPVFLMVIFEKVGKNTVSVCSIIGWGPNVIQFHIYFHYNEIETFLFLTFFQALLEILIVMKKRLLKVEKLVSWNFDIHYFFYYSLLFANL